MRFLPLFLLLVSSLHAQPVTPLPRAHAHNDYEHERPLLDALDHGFTSIEADIHLVDGALLVAHDRDEVATGRTLEALYFAPLQARIRANDGRVYRGEPPLTLLIDIKSNAEQTYVVLRDLLQRYAGMLTVFTPADVEEKAVTVILSGNRPRAMLEAEAIRLAALDGRLSDLDGDAPLSLIPLISDNWFTFGRWYGRDPIPRSLQRRLADVVHRAHTQGRRLRFWATTDNPAVWQALYEAGVDYLNADNLTALRTFLLEQDEGQ